MKDKYDILLHLYYVVDTLIHAGEIQQADTTDRWTLTAFHYELLKECRKGVVELLETHN